MILTKIKEKYQNSTKKQQLAWQILGVIFIAVFVEIFVCNFKYFRFNLECNNSEQELNLSDATPGAGLQMVGEHTFLVLDRNSSGFTFNELDVDVNSIYVDVRKTTPDMSPIKANEVTVYFTITDEGNTHAYNLSEHTLIPDIDKSKWMEIEPYGNLHSIRINIPLKEGEQFEVVKMSLNAPCKFNFQILRVAILCAVGMMMVLFAERSNLLSIKVLPWKRRYVTYILLLLLLSSAVWYYMVDSGSMYYEEEESIKDAQKQYQKLAVSFAEGHVYLNDEVPEYLTYMENPYDQLSRNDYSDLTKHTYLWDTTYYGGHYYVYFGALPVIVFYLPYYLLTGKALPNVVPNFIVCMLLFLAVFKLLHTMVKKWFPDTSLLMYLLVGFTFANGCGTALTMSRATLYELPIICGTLLAVVGIDLWLNVFRNEGRVSYWRLALGSLCIALLTCTRPTIFLCFFSAFIIFQSFLLEKGKLCLHKNVKNILVFALPFVLIAVVVMYYNAIRFGSPFDFGANYNLTNNDMTKRGFRITRIGYSIWAFFVQPLSFTTRFPFLQTQECTSDYLGWIYCEPNYGGILMTNTILLVNLFFFKVRKVLKDKKGLNALCLFFLVCSVVIGVLDANIAGIALRYENDFAWMLYFVAAVVIFSLEAYCKQTGSGNMLLLRRIIILLLFATLVITFLRMWNPPEFTLQEYHPYRFYKMKYLLEPWS